MIINRWCENFAQKEEKRIERETDNNTEMGPFLLEETIEDHLQIAT